MKIYEITRNTSGKVRDKLCVEDIRIDEWEVLSGFGLVTLEVIEGERVLWFKEPVRIPKFNKFYASRITSAKDPYLLELIRRVLYLNPNPDKLMVKKLTEFIVLRFSRMETRESDITDKSISMPVLRFEEIEPIVQACAQSRMFKEDLYLPDNEVPVLFERDSKFSREQRISILAEYRGYLVKAHMESIIHTATEHLIDTKEYFKITNSKLRETGIVQTEKGLASINTISKYMDLRTKKVIDEHNEVAPFKSKKASELYQDFLKLPWDATLDECVEELNISKSTAVEFKRLAEFIN